MSHDEPHCSRGLILIVGSMTGEALNKSKQMLDKDVERFDAFLSPLAPFAARCSRKRAKPCE